MPARRWTVIDLIRWGAEYLGKRGFENARLETERLLGHALGLDRVELYLQFDRPLSPEELKKFRSLLERRLKREPLAYVLGEWEFFGLRLRVRPGVLVPRPETEQLVEICLQHFAEDERFRFVDLGTGSGNIAIALAVHRGGARGWALDISREALRVAAENLGFHGLEGRVALVQADMRAAPLRAATGAEGLDLVVANPPYVHPDEWPDLQPEIREYEPREALVAEPDGLAYYEAVARVARHTLRTGGWVAVEIAENRADAVVKIFRREGLTELEKHQDLAGRDRVLTARRP